MRILLSIISRILFIRSAIRPQKGRQNSDVRENRPTMVPASVMVTPMFPVRCLDRMVWLV